MDTPCDAIIVGSGFGASVLACRLAEAGQRVLVLERGKAYPPGSFARTPDEMRRNLWDPSEGLHGLFDLWSFRGLEALVASGLGGGSLIYANVLMRMPAEWFSTPDPQNGHAPWPISRADLDPFYDVAEDVLGAQRFPFGREPYDRCAKTHALWRAARATPGATWELPPLAISFAAGGQAPEPGQPLTGRIPSLHGKPRTTCTLCGQCDIGCNVGAKNTLDHTYLSAAQAAGATILERAEVRWLEPVRDGGFAVRYVRHASTAEGRPTHVASLPTERIVGRRLILGAGSLGTTFLLLKCRQRAFPAIPHALLGTQFCGNGDLLTFARERRTGRDASGLLEPAFGPVITSAVRGRSGGHDYCIEDGGLPAGLEWILQITSATSRLGRIARVAKRYLRGVLRLDSDSNLSAELSELFGPSALPLLGMGREQPNGRLFLEDGYLQSSWALCRTRPFYRALERQMTAVTARMGADFAGNPLRHLGRVVTVHPLGGCPMGRRPDEGVVDQYGEVFGYPGMHVVDGAAMRGPVGVNPSLTIAAFAERCAAEIVRRDRAARGSAR